MTTITTIKTAQFKDLEMVILKAYVYRKLVNFVNPKTGKEESVYKYLTLINLIPGNEYQNEVEILKNGYPRTNGTFVMVIGSMDGLIPVRNRVNLYKYQKHLEANGWCFCQTVPKAKGKSFEWVQREAWCIIKSIKNSEDFMIYKSMLIKFKHELNNKMSSALNEEKDVLNAVFGELKTLTGTPKAIWLKLKRELTNSLTQCGCVDDYAIYENLLDIVDKLEKERGKGE